MEKSLELEVQELVSDILEDYKANRDIDRMEDFFNQPDKDVIIDIVNKMLRILFPGYYRDKSYRVYNAASQLSMQIEDVMYYRFLTGTRRRRTRMRSFCRIRGCWLSRCTALPMSCCFCRFL